METCKIHDLRGLGFTFVARIYIQKELKRGELVVLPEFELNRPFNLISRNDKNESLAIDVFKKAFVKYCHKLDMTWG